MLDHSGTILRRQILRRQILRRQTPSGRRRPRALLASAAVLALAAHRAHAQPALSAEGAANAGADASTEVASGGVSDIVVTARGRAERLQDVPVSVTAFGQQQIEDARISEVQDFVNLTPNVELVQSESSGLTQMSIRGVTQVRNSESPVAVRVDGVLLNDPREFSQELLDVASIQVLRGPQGALYGRNASGGAIIIDTVQPTDVDHADFRAGVGSGGEYSLEASASGPIVPGELYYRFGVRRLERDGYFQNVTLNQTQDPYEDTSTRGLLKWTPNADLTVVLNGNFSSTRDGALDFRYQPANLAADGKSLNLANPFSATADANLVDRTFYSNNRGHDRRDIDGVSLSISYDLGFATLTSVSAYDRIEESDSGDQFPYLASRNTFGLDGTQTQFITSDYYSEEVRLTSPEAQRLRWMVGGYYLYDHRFISSTTGFDSGTGIAQVTYAPRPASALNPTLSFFGDDNFNADYAVFGNVSYDILPVLEASFAVRYDFESRDQEVSPFNSGGTPGGTNQANFNRWQPRATLAYKPTQDLNFYATYAQGFRSGQFNQNGSGAAAAAAGVGGVGDLVPKEDTDSYEVGFKAQLLDRKLTIDGALFQTYVTNSQYFVFIGAVGAQVLVPIDKTRLRGGELAATADLAPGLSVYGSLGLTDSVIQEYRVNPADVGRRAPYVPQSTLNAGVQWRHEVADGFFLFVRGDYRRLGKQYWDPENTTPRSNVDLADFRLGVEYPEKGVSVVGTVQNAFDTTYNAEYVTGGFAEPAAPRVFRLDLEYKF